MHRFHLRTLIQIFTFVIVSTGFASAPAAAQKAYPKGAGAPALPNGEVAFRTSDSVRLFVKISGKGVPCVFVHGGPGAGSYAFEQLAGRALEGSLQMI